MTTMKDKIEQFFNSIPKLGATPGGLTLINGLSSYPEMNKILSGEVALEEMIDFHKSTFYMYNFNAFVKDIINGVLRNSNREIESTPDNGLQGVIYAINNGHNWYADDLDYYDAKVICIARLIWFAMSSSDRYLHVCNSQSSARDYRKEFNKILKLLQDNHPNYDFDSIRGKVVIYGLSKDKGRNMTMARSDFGSLSTSIADGSPEIKEFIKTWKENARSSRLNRVLNAELHLGYSPKGINLAPIYDIVKMYSKVITVTDSVRFFNDSDILKYRDYIVIDFKNEYAVGVQEEIEIDLSRFGPLTKITIVDTNGIKRQFSMAEWSFSEIKKSGSLHSSGKAAELTLKMEQE